MSEPLRYYLDEDMWHAPDLARALRSRSIDVLTAHEAGRASQAISDDDQLHFADSEHRVMVTQDMRFVPIWPHPGLVVMHRQVSLGTYIEYLETVAHVYTAEEMRSMILYFDW